MLYAIDVSHHQAPSALDWTGMRRAGCDLCIVRLTYGTKLDERAAEHVKRARDAGFAIGAYAFARPTERAVDQFLAFCAAADRAGYGLGEDVIPALDIEDDTSAGPIGPEHADFFGEFAQFFRNWKSRGCFAYITQRDWNRLDKPAWVLDMPLFVAHYAPPSRPEPATPNGMPWCIWQHRVGPFQMLGPSGYDREHPLLDQSRVRRLIFFNGADRVFAEPGDEELRRVEATPDAAELRQARTDAWIRAVATEGLAAANAENLIAATGRAELDTLDDEADVDSEGENQA